jgi:phosphatidylserine decarboxylase
MVREGELPRMLKVLLIAGIALVLIVLFGVYFLRNIWFYRDPKRVAPKKERIIVSPADGKVMYVKRVEDGNIVSEKLGEKIPLTEITKDKLDKAADGSRDGWLIGIYMSPLDVHFNYAPVAGKVEEIVHTQAPVNLPMVDMWEYVQLVWLRRGVDLFARKFHFVNERNTIFMKNEDMSIIVVEIADKFVNKINCFIKEGDQVGISDKVSFIERGSQADVIIFRDDLDIKVKFGDQVYGGETVLAEYGSK